MKIDLHYHHPLYLGDSIRNEKVDTLKKKLKRDPKNAAVFLLTTAGNPHDLLDIYESEQLRWRYYQNNPPYVVGLAASKEEAILLVERIVAECLAVRGDCYLREYLSC
ncbi:MAG: hypothetical protein LBM69_04290 [Lachnospiraceae bacterium]|jgi:hypothetical protein|nr:hypothetical protein [Lachnospiraceae bacterium]